MTTMKTLFWMSPWYIYIYIFIFKCMYRSLALPTEMFSTTQVNFTQTSHTRPNQKPRTIQRRKNFNLSTPFLFHTNFGRRERIFVGERRPPPAWWEDGWMESEDHMCGFRGKMWPQPNTTAPHDRQWGKQGYDLVVSNDLKQIRSYDHNYNFKVNLPKFWGCNGSVCT